MNNNKKKKKGIVEGRIAYGQKGFWIEERIVGAMGLGKVEGSEVRAMSGQQSFWIDELCN